MNQVKIGKFIAERRKEVGLTQAQLAEKLNITDRAVSKWETGRTLPDSSIMIDLCDILKISVTDLLTGEIVTMDNYKEKLEQSLLELAKQKEEADKKLLNVEILISSICIAVLLALCMIAAYVQIEDWLRFVLIGIGLVPILVALPYLIKIEQTAGYYKCSKCGHRYVPEFKSVLWSMHAGRTRYMKCPKCGEKSWQKKVISKQ